MNTEWATLAAACIAAAAAIAGAITQYKGVRRQVEDQAAAEHRHWKRQNRFTAYQDFIFSIGAALEALDQRRTNPMAGNRALLTALEAMLRGQAAIGLTGPEQVLTEAKSATVTVGRIRRQVAGGVRSALPIPPQDMVAMVNDAMQAHERFRMAATTALNDPTL